MWIFLAHFNFESKLYITWFLTEILLIYLSSVLSFTALTKHAKPHSYCFYEYSICKGNASPPPARCRLRKKLFIGRLTLYQCWLMFYERALMRQRSVAVTTGCLPLVPTLAIWRYETWRWSWGYTVEMSWNK